MLQLQTAKFKDDFAQRALSQVQVEHVIWWNDCKQGKKKFSKFEEVFPFYYLNIKIVRQMVLWWRTQWLIDQSGDLTQLKGFTSACISSEF